MYFNMSSAISFNLDQSKKFSSGNGGGGGVNKEIKTGAVLQNNYRNSSTHDKISYFFKLKANADDEFNVTKNW